MFKVNPGFGVEGRKIFLSENVRQDSSLRNEPIWLNQ